MKLAKNQTKAKQQPEAEIFLFENYSLSSSRYHRKKIRDILKNAKKNEYVCFEFIWLMILKMRLKMKTRSHGYDIKRHRPKHGHKYTKKNVAQIMMVICIKQHLSIT